MKRLENFIEFSASPTRRVGLDQVIPSFHLAVLVVLISPPLTAASGGGVARLPGRGSQTSSM